MYYIHVSIIKLMLSDVDGFFFVLGVHVLFILYEMWKLFSVYVWRSKRIFLLMTKTILQYGVLKVSTNHTILIIYDEGGLS